LKNGRVGSDAECEGENGGCGESRALPELTTRVAKVLHKGSTVGSGGRLVANALSVRYDMPHMPGSLQRPLGHTGPGAPFGEPLAWAANVDSSCSRCCLPQLGHSSPATSVERRTSFSNLVPQS